MPSETERVGLLGTSSWNSNGSNEADDGGDFVLLDTLLEIVDRAEDGGEGDECSSFPKTSSSSSSLYLSKMRSHTFWWCEISLASKMDEGEYDDDDDDDDVSWELGDLRFEAFDLLEFFDDVLLNAGDLVFVGAREVNGEEVSEKRTEPAPEEDERIEEDERRFVLVLFLALFCFSLEVDEDFLLKLTGESISIWDAAVGENCEVAEEESRSKFKMSSSSSSSVLVFDGVELEASTFFPELESLL